jgi:hypothetical protein
MEEFDMYGVIEAVGGAVLILGTIFLSGSWVFYVDRKYPLASKEIGLESGWISFTAYFTACVSGIIVQGFAGPSFVGASSGYAGGLGLVLASYATFRIYRYCQTRGT